MTPKWKKQKQNRRFNELIIWLISSEALRFKVCNKPAIQLTNQNRQIWMYISHLWLQVIIQADLWQRTVKIMHVEEGKYFYCSLHVLWTLYKNMQCLRKKQTVFKTVFHLLSWIFRYNSFQVQFFLKSTSVTHLNYCKLQLLELQ